MTPAPAKKTLFVTATGTELGKTYVTCGLIRAFRELGRDVQALKPVISGFSPEQPDNSDTGQILRALEQPLTPDTIDAISPWRFAAPLSPDMAAKEESRRIDFDTLVDFCRARQQQAEDILIIEGVGGLMVPLDDRHTVLDWILALDAEILLVAGTYLGSLSHILTALSVLNHHQRPVGRLILSESAENSVGLARTAATVTKISQLKSIVSLERFSTPDCFSGLARSLIHPA